MGTYPQYNWTGNGDGQSWSDPNNWTDVSDDQDPAQTAPGSGDLAVFGSTATLSQGGDAAFLLVETDGSLTLDGAAVTAIDAQVQGDLSIEDGGAVNATDDTSAVAFVLENAGSVDVTGSGSTVTTVSLYVGIGTGSNATDPDNSLDVSGGAGVVVNGDNPNGVDLSIGQGDNGAVTVTDQGSSLVETGGVVNVGYQSVSKLTIEAGASASFTQSNDFGYALGVGNDGSGVVRVEGSGSTLTTSNGIVNLGVNDGGGELIIEDGGTAALSQSTNAVPVFIVGDGGGGLVDVLGDGSQLQATGSVTQVGVGGGPQSSIQVENGATATFANSDDSLVALDIGVDDGSNGEVIVDDGSEITTTGMIVVGDAGTGALTVENQGMLMANGDAIVGAQTMGTGTVAISTGGTVAVGGALDIGVQAGGVGSVTVSDEGSTLQGGSGDITVGDEGTGTLTVENGAGLTFDGDQIVLGSQTGSTGEFDVEDQGTDLALDTNLVVGDLGNAIMNVMQGASLEVTSLYIAEEAPGAASPSVNVKGFVNTGATLTVDNDFVVGVGGEGWLQVSGATLDYNGDMLTLGQDNGSWGHLLILHSVVNYDGAMTIGDAGRGSFDLDNNASMTSSDVVVGNQAGSRGNALIGELEGGAKWTITGDLTVGLGGGGDLDVDHGSSTTIDGALRLGVDAGVSGTLEVGGNSESGAASLTVQGAATLGVAGTGILTINRGSVVTFADGLTIGGPDPTDGTGTVFANNGSTINVDGAVDIGAGSDIEVENGSSLYIDGNLTLSSDATFDATGKGQATTVQISGNVVTGDKDLFRLDDSGVFVQILGDATFNGTELVNNDNELTISGAMDLSAQATDTDMFTVTDAGTRLNVTGDVAVGDAGTATIDVLAGAVVTTGGALSVGAQASGNGTVDVSGGGSTWTAGVGDVTLADAGTASVTVDQGATFDAAVNYVTLAAQAGSNAGLAVADDGTEFEALAMTVAGAGDATVTVSTGGDLHSLGDVTIGDQSGADGVVTLADTESTMEVDGGLTVGNAGKGQFTVDGAATVSGTTTVGAAQDGNGAIAVNVGTATFGALTVGDAGSGSVLVQLAGTLKAQDVTLGATLGSSGTLTADGTGTSVTTQGLTVGVAGQGAFTVTDGAQVTTNADASFGGAVSANVDTGSVATQGLWTVADTLTIGDSGIATVGVQTGGAIAVSGDLVLGSQAGASGELDVSGVSAGDSTASSVTYGGTLTIAEAGDGTLKIAQGADVAATPAGSGAIEIAAQSGAAGVVTIDGAGSLLSGIDLWVGGAPSGPGGTGDVALSNGGEISAANVTVWSGSSIMGSGTVNGAVTDDGTVTASGGALEITGAVGGTGVLAIDSGASLQLDGAAAGGVTVDFDPAVSETLVVNDLTANAGGPPQNFNASIENFQAGDVIAFAASGLGGAPAITNATPGAFDSTANTTSVVLADGDEAIATLLFAGDYSGWTFTVTASGDNFDLTAPPCYCAGTRILTDKGEITVENLAIGDVVITARGERRPIVWLGHRTVDIAKYYSPEAVRPIRVKAGALGEKVPSRDLQLSPDHALLVEGVLIQAGALVNGTSIVRETEVPEVFVYYHVELDDHALILAENAPAETFVDNVDRLGFDNWAEHEALYPDGKTVEELPLPRAKSRRQVPMHIRAALDERARAFCAEEISAVA